MACSANCSMCSMKFADAVFGAFAGAGTVRNVHCAGFSVLPAKDGNLAVETGYVKFKCYLSKLLLQNQ